MRSHRPIILVIGTVVANLVFLLLSPPSMVPPRLSEQMGKALLTLGLSFVPFAWGFYLLFTYRNAKERMLAYLAIAVSLLWIGTGTDFIIQVMKEHRIYRPNKSPQATRNGVSRSVSRFTLVGPACLSSGRSSVFRLPSLVSHLDCGFTLSFGEENDGLLRPNR